jgi:hypothetical protein
MNWGSTTECGQSALSNYVCSKLPQGADSTFGLVNFK